MNTGKLLLLIVVLALIASYFLFDLGQYFSLAYLQSSIEQFNQVYEANPAMVIGIFFLIYVTVTAVSLPGAAVMTIAAGALFGLLVGTIIVSFASTIGATLAFLVSRWLLRDWVEEKFKRQMRTINAGIERDGALYLFSLRLVPAIPFFVINLAMGLTKLKVWSFYWVSQIGMLAGTVVYVNAGVQVRQLDSIGGLLSPQLIGAFVLLATFPWIARGIMRVVNRRVVYRGFQRPRSFDRNLVVIGAGSGGLVSAYIAATVKAGVTLIEKQRMGGDCLYTGCVPSKSLIKSAGMMDHARRFPEYGLEPVEARADFPAVMERIQNVIRKIEPHDSIERYESLGVDCRTGHARLISPWEVEIDGDAGTERLTTRSIVIATGARPVIPDIPGLDEIDPADQLTSENIWDLREQPQRLLVLGGGPIGCELSQSFARLGSAVIQVEMNDRVMSRDEPEASALVATSLRADGVDLRLQTKAERFAVENGENVMYASHNGEEIRMVFDKVLLALGRRANTDNLGLEALEIDTRPNGTIETNDYLQTRFPNIYACGDVAGPFQFTHTASHQAWYAAVNALFGMFRKFKTDYRVIPWTTFTDPEVAHVGLTRAMAREQDIEVEVTTYQIDDLDRAIADGNDRGFVQVLTPPGADRILGVTIVGTDAGNLIAEYVLAMKHKLGLNKILGTIHIYPTMAEANKFAAGAWKKANAPERLLAWVKRFHDWRR
jgi:pyruvate/2-oxoglutarate dehydrogenase complex dihydrolipoamide dehydrogenase (E3) component/uncharacterized membrane protein YdjX (TVP38/TMEM64 family)